MRYFSSFFHQRNHHSLFYKRLEKFTQHKRGIYSFYTLAIICMIAFMASLLCNEKPLLVYYDGCVYLPMFKTYDETTFGGELQSEADYKDSAVKALIEEKGFMVQTLVPFSPDTITYTTPSSVPSAPSLENWLGTDDQGRDVLARLIYGLRSSLVFGFALTIISVMLGILIGAVQGYFGGRIDLIGQRFTEIWSGLPILYVLIIMSSLIEPSFGWLLGIMMLFNWMVLSSVVRTEFLKTRSLDYIRAAESMGASSFQIMMKHILPNAMVSLITYIPFLLNTSISTLTALDFLGFGLPPGDPSLGELVLQAKNNPESVWLSLTAFLSIACILALISFIGEAVREACDPGK